MSPLELKSLMTKIIDIIKSLDSEIQKKRYEIVYKSDGSPVTGADKLIEKHIHDFLDTQINDLLFIGEETFDFTWSETNKYIAILDPIDGTENFCSGLKEWGVSFGLWKGPTHLCSMLFMPELNETIMTGDKLNRRKSRITGFSSSYNEEISIGIKNSVEYRVTGCAVYNLMNVIRGSFTKFNNPKGAYIWDLLPGAMLALEHGLEVKLNGELYNGQLLNPTRKYSINIQ